MNTHYSFSAEYFDVFSRKKRKDWNTTAFETIYGAVSKEELFFAQTFSDFSAQAIEYKDQDRLVAHKMRLGAVKMLVIIGYSSLEWAVTNEEAIINELRSKGSEKNLIGREIL